MKRILYIVFFISLFASSSYGQTYKAYMKAAEKAYEQNNYYGAYKYLQEAYLFDTTKLEHVFQSAEMMRMYNAHARAEELYTDVVDRDSDNKFPTATYYCGEMLQKQGKYQAAIEKFDLYLSEQNGEDEYFTKKALKEKSACENALQRIKMTDESVTVTRLANINTQYSEVAPLEKDGELYYSSLRFPQPNPTDIRDPKYLSKILVSEGGKDGKVISDINNDTQIIAHSAFSNKSNRFYYTVCDYNEFNDIKCAIYYSEVTGKNKFGKSVRLPDYINDTMYTSTQPAIGYDINTNKEILYFVSNKPGGKGKFDIWYSIIDDNMNFTQPMNLESVNTVENDITPFFHIPSNTLYFSSQGYLGMGGYDIYRAEKIGDSFGEIGFLENPVNSSFDDIYYTLSNDMLKGYFSSNKLSSTYIEDEIDACCFDIYEAKYVPVLLDLDVLTCEEVEGNSRKLLGATVCLIDARTNEIIDSITNYNDDVHHFELTRNKEYLIVTKKAHYLSDTVTLSTKNIFKTKTFTKKICLVAKTLDLDVFLFDNLTMEALKGGTLVVRDLTDGTIKTITDFNENGNDFHYKVKEAHTYLLIGSKENYGTKSVELNTLTAKIVEGRIRQDILLAFGPMYLPLDLYFDNDKPDSRSTRRTTKSNYTIPYNEFYAKKQEFIENSSTPELMPDFFEFEVKGGFDTLQIFLKGMKNALDQQKKIEITIQGFTSPRSSNKYNLYLGQRRVQSVKNEIIAFFGDEFKGYIDSGQLKITEISYGESLAPKEVDDSIADKKASIYSYEASKERKVRIVQVNLIK